MEEIDKIYIFIRHGEIYYGSWMIWRAVRFFFADIDDPPLSCNGFIKAKEVAEKLKSEGYNIENMIVSPFTRCMQTALQVKSIFQDIKNFDLNVLISEYQQFPWEYKCSNYPNGLPKEFEAKNKSKIQLVFPEHYDQLKQRCTFFLNNVMNEYNNLAIITHGSLINYFASILKPREEPYNINFSGYIKVIEYKDGRKEIEINENP